MGFFTQDIVYFASGRYHIDVDIKLNKIGVEHNRHRD